MDLKARADGIRRDLRMATEALIRTGWTIDELQAARLVRHDLGIPVSVGPVDNRPYLHSTLKLTRRRVQLTLCIQHDEHHDTLTMSATSPLGRLDFDGGWLWTADMLDGQLQWTVQSIGRLLRLQATEVISTLKEVGGPPSEAA